MNLSVGGEAEAFSRSVRASPFTLIPTKSYITDSTEPCYSDTNDTISQLQGSRLLEAAALRRAVSYPGIRRDLMTAIRFSFRLWVRVRIRKRGWYAHYPDLQIIRRSRPSVQRAEPDKVVTAAYS